MTGRGRGIDKSSHGPVEGNTSKVEGMGDDAKGMVLPFKPLNLTFAHLWYSVDFPKVSMWATGRWS